jgi:hypothetical protein
VIVGVLDGARVGGGEIACGVSGDVPPPPHAVRNEPTATAAQMYFTLPDRCFLYVILGYKCPE